MELQPGQCGPGCATRWPERSRESMTGIEPAYSAWECDLMALPQVGGLVLRGGVSRVFRVLVASVCVPDGGQTRMQPQSRLTAFSQWHGDFSCSTTKFGQLTRMRLTNSRIGGARSCFDLLRTEQRVIGIRIQVCVSASFPIYVRGMRWLRGDFTVQPSTETHLPLAPTYIPGSTASTYRNLYPSSSVNSISGLGR